MKLEQDWYYIESVWAESREPDRNELRMLNEYLNNNSAFGNLRVKRTEKIPNGEWVLFQTKRPFEWDWGGRHTSLPMKAPKGENTIVRDTIQRPDYPDEPLEELEKYVGGFKNTAIFLGLGALGIYAISTLRRPRGN